MIYNKKSSIIMILKTLEEYSDEEHFLTQQDIISKIENNYGITLERKSVAYSLSLLEELDYGIEKGPKGGYALFNRLLEPSEITFLIDACFSSKAISSKQAISIAKRLQSILSVSKRKSYSYIYKAGEVNRTSSKETFYALDTIEEGIKRGKRISFQYASYDEKGNETLRMDGYHYIVSPYYLCNSNGFYYLICNYREKYAPINIFRIDLMRNLSIKSDWDIKPMKNIKGLENFSISDYLNEHIYLYGGESIDAILRIEKPIAITHLKDWFGKNAKIYRQGDVLLAKVKVNEGALFYWILQYGDEFTLMEPSSMVDRLKNHFASQIEKYSK